MQPLRHHPPFALGALLFIAAVAAMTGGCGSTATPYRAHTLPANILAQPRGVIGLVTTNYASPMRTALRALGIPYRTVPLAQVRQSDLSTFQIVILDENALDPEQGFSAYGALVENVKKYAQTLIILRQQTETMHKASAAVPFHLNAREVEYRLALRPARGGDPVLAQPNPVSHEDLDSLSVTTHQLVFAGRDARAVISANLDAPDSSAALLWEPQTRGAIWYLAFPVAAPAADGNNAERKILCNLLSSK